MEDNDWAKGVFEEEYGWVDETHVESCGQVNDIYVED